VTLASELQPDLRQVFVVSGAQRGDRANEALARVQLRAFQPRLTVTYLAAMPTRELEARLKALPAHSMVFYLTVTGDGAGDNFQPLEYVDRVTAVANVPTYSWVDSTMGRGIVGGSLKDQEAETAAIAKLAVRVLKGEPADAIPLSTPDLNVRQVDWRQLRRWGIDEARVPAGTLVLYRQPRALVRYKWYIASAAALVLAQAALIAGLLVQADRRRRAEQRLRKSQERLRASYERIRDLGRRLLAAQEVENSRLARELHDDISQQLTVLSLDLQFLSRGESDRSDETGRLAGQALERAEAIALSLRNLSHRLHPANLRLIGLVPALARLQADLSTPATAITFSHENVPGGIPTEVALCLFRVAQEALHNAVKHSGAPLVSVHLEGTPDGLVLTIRDEGRGFDVNAARQGLGLISMEERVAQMGGSLRIQSTPGGGTQLEVVTPVGTGQTKEARAV
jgi:signal transduction histidine kinase